MAEEHHHNHHPRVETHEVDAPVVREEEAVPVEARDRGLFDFIGKKEEEHEKPPHEEVIVADFEEKVNICEAEDPKVEEDVKHGSLLEKLQRSDSSSSSSSNEEEGDEGKKNTNKKKKGLKEKIKDKVSGEKKEEEEAVKEEDVAVIPVDVVAASPPAEEKKGFLEKIKEKLPGGHKKPAEEVVVVTAAPPLPSPLVAVSEVDQPPCREAEQKQKKGLLEKIKEKLPGYHPKKSVEEEKDNHKEKECGSD